MSAQLASRQPPEPAGSFWLTPFGGVLIEPERHAHPGAGTQLIDQSAFDQLLQLTPDLDPDLVKSIMGVAIRPEGTS
ncbi:hypothetical protein GCM10027258_93260 [Amycolatopsis stemonae]